MEEETKRGREKVWPVYHPFFRDEMFWSRHNLYPKQNNLVISIYLGV